MNDQESLYPNENFYLQINIFDMRLAINPKQEKGLNLLSTQFIYSGNYEQLNHPDPIVSF